MGLRQAGYTLPRWRALVWGPLRSSGVQPAAAAAMLAAFGAACSAHSRVQARVFAEEGVVAVGLANAVRCALPRSACAGKGARSSRSTPAKCAHSIGMQCWQHVQCWPHRGAGADRDGLEG